MVDTREHSSKKPRISVSRRHIKRYSESSSWSPDQAKIMDIAVHEQAAQTTVVEAPTFWTKCNKCNIRYKYYVNVMGKVIRCRHCVEAFVANEIFPNANLGNQTSYFLSSYQQPANSAILDPVSCSPLQKNRLLADNGGVVQKIEYYGAENHGNESEVNGSATRMALAGEKLVESFNPDRSILKSELLSDDLFKQGLQLMIKGFCGRARSANVEQLVDLLRYGNIILQSSADLSIPDPGLSALLENLKQQATDVISCQSSVTHSTAAHASLLDSAKVADFETSEAVALLTSIDEHVVEYTKRVERLEASLAEAKEKEEMARRARIQAEEDLARQKNELTVGEASREKAKHAWKEKDDASVKAKEEAVKGHDELQLLKKVLSASEAKWRSLCEEAPGVKDWVL